MSAIATMYSASRATRSRSIHWGRVALVSLATVIAALVANLLVYYLGDALVGYNQDFIILATAGGTVFFTVFLATAAVLVYAAVLRLARNPVRTYTIIAAVALIVSIIPDITHIPSVEGASNAQTAILILMHVVAAGVIVSMLTTFARPHGER